MIIEHITVQGYKPYATQCRLEIRPVTVLVGPNNSGKSALARLIPLVAGGLLADQGDPIPLESLGIRHGTTFHDLLSNRSLHGKIALKVGWKCDGEPIQLELEIQAVAVGHGADVRQVIVRWGLSWKGEQIELSRPNLDEARYEQVNGGGTIQLAWSGLWPEVKGEAALPDWIGRARDRLRKWARGVYYLKSPRAMPDGPFRVGAHPNGDDISGGAAALLLASDEALEAKTNQWFERMFKVGLEVSRTADVAQIVIRAPGSSPIPIEQGGQGLAQVLPVIVAILAAVERGEGVDLIEHPEAELHPGVHEHVAELLLEGRCDLDRPLLIETHAEMLLLRIRRQIAEGRLRPEQVAIYWVDRTAEGAEIREVRLHPSGAVENWPEGVFYEDYEEVLAIRRAARKHDSHDAHPN